MARSIFLGLFKNKTRVKCNCDRHGRGIFDFSLRDQEENYRRLIRSLVYDITRDFRPR